MIRSVGLVALLLLAPSAWAQYRCAENGKTVFTDHPCAEETQHLEGSHLGNAPKVIGDAGNSAYSSPYGTWRGQVQFQATGAGGVIRDAMAVIPMTIDIDPQGKVKASSPENGCVLQGIASPGMAPISIGLDVTLSNCRYSGFNRRLSGTLILYQSQKYAQFSLNGSNASPFDRIMFFDIKGTMRR